MQNGKDTAEAAPPADDFTEQDWITMEPSMAGHEATYEEVPLLPAVKPFAEDYE